VAEDVGRSEDTRNRLSAYDFPGYPHAKADVRWLLDRVTQLEAGLTLIADGGYGDASIKARAALDTEQP
jgi:hypothetical protein